MTNGGGFIPKTKENVTGYTCGVFDLFHIGHLNLLRNARSMCGKLIVGVSTDQLVLDTKGEKPLIPFEQRIEIVRNINFVDVAIPQYYTDKYRAWELLKYNILFVGDDWYGKLDWQKYEKDLSKKGVLVVYLPYTENISSTKINQILEEKRGSY